MAESESLRGDLVAALRRQGYLRDARVAMAFGAVPREVFVSGRALAEVYTDRALVTKMGDRVPVSTSSQPAMMARMLQQLAVAPGQHVLEIGTGTGYQAALLARLVAPGGRVTSVELDGDLAERARANLHTVGAHAVHVVAADGGAGYRRAAPYDRIIATASCWEIPRPWWDQCREGGRIVLPLRLNGIQIAAALRKHDGLLKGADFVPCVFLALGGRFRRRYETDLGARGVLRGDAPLSRALRRAIAAGGSEEPIALALPASFAERADALLFLALQGMPITEWEAPGRAGSTLVIEAAADSFLLLRHSGPRVHAASCGTPSAADAVRRALAGWDSAGRPGADALRLVVRPSASPLPVLPRPAEGAFVFGRGDGTYELTYRPSG